MSFWNHKKKSVHTTYDKTVEKPAIRASICTGEKVAGFRNLKDGHFTSVKLIQSDKDLQDFKDEYGIEGEVEIFY